MSVAIVYLLDINPFTMNCQ